MSTRPGAGSTRMADRRQYPSEMTGGTRREQYDLELNTVIGPAEAEPTRISARYEVSSDGNTYDAFEIATRALAAWDAFLRSHGLLSTP